MTNDQLSAHEESFRLRELAALGVLDTQAERRFDELVQLAATIAETPMALISFIDRDRQWIKAKVGLDASEVPRHLSFCTHAVAARDLLVVGDALEDERFRENPFVVEAPFVRFYAGAPLFSANGAAIGTLCVIDLVPRRLPGSKLDALRILSRQVAAQLDLTRIDRERKALDWHLDDVVRHGNIGLFHFDLVQGKGVYRGNPGALWPDDAVRSLTPQQLSDLYHPDDQRRIDRAFQDYLDGVASDYSVEMRMRSRDGSYHWYLAQGMTVERDPEGKPVRMRGIHVDVTQHRAMEQELAHAARLASIGALAAGVGHEINNALTFMRGNVGVAQDALAHFADSHPSFKAVTVRVLEALQDAAHGAERVGDIVSDLHSLTRPDDDVRAPLDLIDVIETSMRMVRNELKHRAHLVRHYEVRPTLVGNARRLGQLFVNLLVNAAQALPEGDVEHHTVTVRVYDASEGHVMVEVRDTGIGISAEVLPHVFDPFFTTKAAHMGTGLGLAICRRVAESHAGQISATSVQGQGTTIRVRLPVQGTVSAPKPVEVDSPAIPTLTIRRGRVLVIDDEPAVGRMVTRFLTATHDVFVEQTAGAGLARIEAGDHFDAILCDLRMPSMTGREFHLALQSLAPALANRVIFISGGTRDSVALDVPYPYGGRVLEKPFSLASLTSAVQRCLNYADSPEVVGSASRST